MNRPNTIENVTPSEVIECVESCAQGIINLLQEASQEFIGELRSSPAPRIQEAIHPLEMACRCRLNTAGSVSGMGFVGAPEQELAQALTLLWWIKKGEDIRVKKHVLNPASDSYYDYNTSEWFGTTRATGKPFISAPYVDSWGTDQLVITAAVPLTVQNAFIGVIAADLDPVCFLRPIEKMLLHSDNITLIDPENRVILSSDPLLTTGISLKRHLDRSGKRPLRQQTSLSTNWTALEVP